MGIEIVSKTDEIIKRLKSEGKIEILNKPKHIKAILEMNDEMEKVRREYIIKSQNSERGQF